ncbi:PolC-type DNA polymerase III [Clostridium sp. DL1XJH146]
MSNKLINELKNEFENNEFLLADNIEISKIQFASKQCRLKVHLKSINTLNDKKEDYIKKIILKKLNGLCEVDLILTRDIKEIDSTEIISKYWNEIIHKISCKFPVCKNFMISCNKEIKDNNLIINLGNEFIVKLLKTRRFEEELQKEIYESFGFNIKPTLIYDKTVEEKNNTLDNVKEKQEQQLIKKIIENTKNTTQQPKKEPSQNDKYKRKNNDNFNKYSSSKNNPNVLMGREITGEIIEIKEIEATSGVVNILGDLFKLDIIVTKSGKKIFTFCITDYSSSITVKCFPRPKDVEKLEEELRKGMHIKLRGEATFDTYQKEVVIIARDILKATKIEKMDTYEEKRVELHLHTQMSAMDGISPASSLIKRAAKWGHKAIGITDHGVVQAYPEAMDAAKKYNIKVLYGVEAYFVDDGEPIALKCDNKNINDTFVVFDIETTGFSSSLDKIIEIGAVKIQNGHIIDSFNYFVNPKCEIPLKIIELTGINNEMVKGAETIDSVLPKFLEFAKESVLVAHNSNFDISFIRQNCSNMGFKFDFSSMDTIPLCKFLYPELKRYKLNTVCKHLGISLANHHRAVDDALATAKILLKSFQELKNKDIYEIEKLNKTYLETIDIKKMNTYHLIIYAKNKIGLKNLYKLISFSNLDYFHRRPRLAKSLIEKYKEGLIIGSACEAGQVYKAVLEGKEENKLKEIIEFYDYLEIQPIDNNKFMIKKGIVKTREDLRKINHKICELGEKYKKPVVATCDVHFLDEKDSVFREILMFGKGFSDASDQAPLYLRTTTEMLKEFEYLGEEKAKEVVIYNTNKIADSIENIKPIPSETFPPKIEGAEEEIRQMTMDKARTIYGDSLPAVVNQRLEKELNSIISNGYAVLYLIAQKLVAKSYADGYLVGSRGSVGSSLVATMCDITEVNGLPAHYICPKCKYSEFIEDGSVACGVDLPDKECPKCGEKFKKDGFDIPFATFLGFNGDKEPDIDLNFSGDNQQEIHKYTEVLFGKGHTFKAGTIGTIAEKTAYGYVRKYVEENNLRLNSAEIDRLTQGCTGVKRTSGQHPGGIMVVPADNEIYNFCPIQHPADDPNSDIITTHFDYHSISGRLLKLDILGHDDPTVLRMLKDLTNLDPKDIDIGDEKILSLFTSTEGIGVSEEELECPVATFGLPEFGTKFVRQMLLDTKPKTFSDLVRISGLSHGTDVWLNNAQYYIKEGYTTLKDCIATRDDIMMYLMYKGVDPQYAFTIMEKVRKGKGLTEEHEKLMRDNQVPDWYIESCKKIKYMFPKGHAVAYVMMAMRIAYYKVYYPKEYYATYFTVRGIDDFDADLICQGIDTVKVKMNEIIEAGKSVTQKDKNLLTVLELVFEMYKRGIKLLKVDVYKSHAIKFLIEEDGIRPPLHSLAGVGINAAKGISAARKDGEFISKEDLRLRSKATKSVIETLSNHGCLNGLPETNQLCLF